MAAVRAWAAQVGPDGVRRELERIDPRRGAVLFRMLAKTHALRAFEDLDPPHQQALLAGLRADHVTQVIAHLDPDDRARLLDEMPAAVARRLLRGLNPQERRMTAELLGYPEDSVGRVMSPEVLRLPSELTVAEALARVRQRGGGAETVEFLPVTDRERRFITTIRLADLVMADPASAVADLPGRDDLWVNADADQEQAARALQDADAAGFAVLDGERRLVGILTVDDAMDVLEAADSEDFARGGGTEPLRRPYFTSSLLQLARTRAAWLLVLIVAATLTINVLQIFEGALEQILVLALFIPLLMNTGGNAGAQASTTMVRSLALGDVRPTDASRVFWRELRVGLMLGLMLGVLGFAPVSLIYGADIAAVVALTLMSVVTLASAVGALLPLIARRLGVDPALMSAPLVTTLIDATGLLIYFTIATVVLGL